MKVLIKPWQTALFLTLTFSFMTVYSAYFSSSVTLSHYLSFIVVSLKESISQCSNILNLDCMNSFGYFSYHPHLMTSISILLGLTCLSHFRHKIPNKLTVPYGFTLRVSQNQHIQNGTPYFIFRILPFLRPGSIY